LYWRSPESGGVWFKSRQLKRKICCPVQAHKELEKAKAEAEALRRTADTCIKPTFSGS
jgi:hypothetical protein